MEVTYQAEADGTRRQYRVRNRGGQTVTLTRVSIESLPAEIGSPGEILPDAHYGFQPRETFFTGRVDDGLLVLRNPRVPGSAWGCSTRHPAI